ncbi:MAG: cell division protein FtsQ/DivIB [Anaerolineae bacterium]|nr:cell division protein FtsQ/DivIB [Anaerolineae bacterium]
MAKREYYRTASLLSAQPHTQVERVRQRSWRVSWQLFIVVLFLAGIAFWLWLDPRWYVDSSRVQIAGTSSLPLAKEAVLAGDVLNTHGLWINSARVITRVLSALPAVEDVELACRPYPAYCLFTLAEREPVLAWKTEGRVQWVDAEGVFFPAWEERPELPCLQGPLPAAGTLPPNLAESVTALLALDFPTEELRYHPQVGVIWENPQGWQVVLGLGAAQMEQRWQVYQSLLVNLSGRGILPKMVDVRFPDAVTYAASRHW